MPPDIQSRVSNFCTLRFKVILNATFIVVFKKESFAKMYRDCSFICNVMLERDGNFLIYYDISKLSNRVTGRKMAEDQPKSVALRNCRMQIQKLQASFLETMFGEEKIEFRARKRVYCRNHLAHP